MVKTLISVLIAATLVNGPLAAQEFLKGEIMLSLHEELPEAVFRSSSGRLLSGLSSLDNVLAQHRAQAFERFSGYTAYGRRLYWLKVPSTVNIDNVLQDLRNNPNVEHAERVEILKTVLTPNDPKWTDQWNFDASHLRAADAWDIETGSNNVILAILDTGLDYDHPDLTQNIWRGTDTPIGLDFCGPRLKNHRGEELEACDYVMGTTDNDPQHIGGDVHSHGTKMAGVAAAKINNTLHVAGLAGGVAANDGVRIMGLRAGHDYYDSGPPAAWSGEVFTHKATDALNFVVAHQGRNPDLSYVVNMSFASSGTGTPSPNPMFQTAINNAWNTGRVVLVAGARGANSNVRAYPAAYDNVVGVTGVTGNDQKGTDTGYGAYIDVAAPVDNVPTVAYNATTGAHIGWTSRGTTPSISAAQVSGLAALIWSKYPELTNAGVVHQIVSTADDISAANAGQVWSGQIGSGRINAYRALTEWSGELLVQAGATLTWSGTITITGDVTIPAGITLELEAGTEVRFLANTDDTGGGTDATRSELIVEGTLDASAGSITFRSAITDMPSASDWYGIRVVSGGSANLSNAALRDGMRCVENDADGDVTLTGTTFTNCGLEPLASIVGPTTPSVEESLDAAGFSSNPVDVGVYTNTDPNPNAPVWSLIGADADEFNLVQKTSNANNERTLQFKQPPNYEVPLEGGGYKTTYVVGVKVTDTPVSGAVGTNGDALADTLLVMVTVTNVEEGGSVTLAPLPLEVGTATVATLTDPDEGIVFTGARWTWQRRASETAAWEPVSAAVGGTTDHYAELRSYTPVDADIGYQLRATVSYTDNYGPNNTAESDASSAVIAATHRLLAITGPDSVSYAEHDTAAVGPYTVTGEPGVTITWSRLGADAAAFTLDGGVLRFAVPPNFEAPADVDTDNEYAVSVVASDGTVADTLDVTVTVTNVEEAGTLVLSPLPPQVDVPLQVELSDADGQVRDVEWEWWRQWPPWQGWRFSQKPPPYTPSQWREAGYQLQVRVSYQDGYGTARDTLVSAWTDSVRTNVPKAPQQPEAVPLSASSVVLSWDACPSHGGSAIEHYAYRQREGTEDWSAWSVPVAGGGSARRDTVAGLQGNTHYSFGVRAENAKGAFTLAAGSPTLGDSPGGPPKPSQEQGLGCWPVQGHLL